MIKTGINIETVKESKLNPHNTFRDSESSHLNNCICTGVFDNPTSIKVKKESIVVNITDPQVIKWDPLIPIFLPKNPDTIEANKGSIIIVKYII